MDLISKNEPENISKSLREWVVRVTYLMPVKNCHCNSWLDFMPSSSTAFPPQYAESGAKLTLMDRISSSSFGGIFL